jgi:tetratricopeptide (TPR) repeat protein
MASVSVKYKAYAKWAPPQPIRLANVNWAGAPVKMQDGNDPQPWHCLPFVEGSTYGLEVVYPYETECQVVNAGGTIHFEFDFAKEPGGELFGTEFLAFSPVNASKYYLFSSRMDVQCPPGYVLRTEPHPRYFTDETRTVPLPMIGHLQNEWYPRKLFMVFRAPFPGERHIFRKGEPFAQILFVPQRMTYDLSEMTDEETARRNELEKSIQSLKLDIADHVWRHPDGGIFNNHYKLLARAFARDGMAGVQRVAQEAAEHHAELLNRCQTVADLLALGDRLMAERKSEQARYTFAQVLQQEPNNLEALCKLGICYTQLGFVLEGIERVRQAIAIDPEVPICHLILGDLLRRQGRLEEAEHALRATLLLNPQDVNALMLLATTLVQQGRTAEGLQAYRTAAALGQALPSHQVNLGMVLTQHNLHAEARACFEAALALDPGYLPARRGLQELAKVGA